MLGIKYYACCCIRSFHVSQEFLALAVEDFSFSQSVYQDELRHLDR
jgi:hypothetical protein